MLKFYEFEEKVQTMSAQLSWSHYCELLFLKNIKTIYDNKTVGIIICKKNNEYIIEYCSDNRIISREFKLI